MSNEFCTAFSGYASFLAVDDIFEVEAARVAAAKSKAAVALGSGTACTVSDRTLKVVSVGKTPVRLSS